MLKLSLNSIKDDNAIFRSVTTAEKELVDKEVSWYIVHFTLEPEHQKTFANQM